MSPRSAAQAKLEDAPASELADDGASVVTAPALAPLHLAPPGLGRAEVVALVAASIVLHGLVAVRVARARTEAPPPRVQQVVIEMERPPVQPVVVPPQAAQPERPKPERQVLRKAEPRVVPKLEPAAPPEAPAPATEELAALPEGDDPALATASGTATEPVAAPPPPPAPAAPAGPIIAAREGANYLKNPRPAYPDVALRRGWQGQVHLRVHVSPEGRPLAINVQTSSGRDVLDQAAIAAVRGWTFVPARQGDQAIAGWVNVPIVFNLQ